MQTFLDLLIIAAKFAVGLWPVMFLALLIGISKREKGFGAAMRSSITGLIISWGSFGILRLGFYLMKMETFHLIAEPGDTALFLAVGLLLFPFEVALLLEEKRKKFTATTLEEIRSLSPSDFEEMVADTYRTQGNTVQVVGGTGDHGIDLIVRSRAGNTYLVQCKRYRGKVGEPVVRDFYGTLRASDANGGAIITTGTITDAARLWAEGKPIHLYDGDQFLKVVLATRVRKNLPTAAKNNPNSPKNAQFPAAAVSSRAAAAVMQPTMATASYVSEPLPLETYSTPVTSAVSAPVSSTTAEPEQDKRPFMVLNEAPECPACGVPMVLHIEKHFLRPATKVYICPNAPQCTQTHAYEE
jgi:Restriction endonuclease